jgi:peroxiredoxin
MIKTIVAFRPVLVLGLALTLIFIAGCSGGPADLVLNENPALKTEAEGILPAAGGGAAQATNPEAESGVVEIQPALGQAPAELAPAEQAGTESGVETAPADPPEVVAESGQETGPEAFAGPLPPVDPSIGNLAPDFSLGTFAGSSLSLADLRGKAVVLNYWVTWCVPCREEMPDIETVYQEYQDEGLVVVSINGTKQDAMTDIEAFLDEVNVSFPVLLDHSEEVYNNYRILFMPTSFFIDPQGVIQDIVLGSTDAAGFRNRVEQLVSTLN